MAMAGRAQRASGIERSVVLSLVLLLHLAVIWVLRPHFAPRVQGAPPTTTAIIFSSMPGPQYAAEDIPISFAHPTTGWISPPVIEIVSSENFSSIKSGNLTDHPPRLDPQWTNASPFLPAGLRAEASGIPALIIVVRALVLETGTVAAAEISGSSGFPDIDAFALADVKAKWRFLPAASNGKPMRDWVTVQVLLKPT